MTRNACPSCGPHPPEPEREPVPSEPDPGTADVETDDQTDSSEE